MGIKLNKSSDDDVLRNLTLTQRFKVQLTILRNCWQKSATAQASY